MSASYQTDRRSFGRNTFASVSKDAATRSEPSRLVTFRCETISILRPASPAKRYLLLKRGRSSVAGACSLLSASAFRENRRPLTCQRPSQGRKRPKEGNAADARSQHRMRSSNFLDNWSAAFCKAGTGGVEASISRRIGSRAIALHATN
jgi:hypothetical protein